MSFPTLLNDESSTLAWERDVAGDAAGDVATCVLGAGVGTTVDGEFMALVMLECVLMDDWFTGIVVEESCCGPCVLVDGSMSSREDGV